LTYSRIELEVIKGLDIPLLKGYPSEFSQVILNLLDNAKDVLIERKVNHPKIIIETILFNNEVRVNIMDNAGGIDGHIIDKIFDIYFSTKREKGGSGLGLYMSKLIIEQKGMGRLSVYNQKEGAVFSICLNLALI